MRVYHGRTLAAAREAWMTAPDISASAKPNHVWETNLVWIEALAPKPIRADELKVPFPIVGRAHFATGRVWFRNVEFGGITGFDDSGKTILSDEVSDDPVISLLEELATVMIPFYVLRPPSTLPWMLYGRPEETTVSRVDRRSHNGILVECLNLDPYMVGNVAVAMVFPASEVAFKFFVDYSSPIDDTLNLLRRIPNVHLLRFVEPEHLDVSQD